MIARRRVLPKSGNVFHMMRHRFLGSEEATVDESHDDLGDHEGAEV
jgi:hypothetical protein